MENSSKPRKVTQNKTLDDSIEEERERPIYNNNINQSINQSIN